MSGKKAEKIFQILLWAIVISAVVGMALLIGQANPLDLALFEFITFSFSLIAVTLAILGSISSLRQSRTMEKISREMRNTLIELKEIDRDNELIIKKIQKDYELSRATAETLAEINPKKS